MREVRFNCVWLVWALCLILVFGFWFVWFGMIVELGSQPCEEGDEQESTHQPHPTLVP